MPDAITASCLCSRIRLLCGQPVGQGSYCHCMDCQKQAGSAFSVAIPFSSDQFRIQNGKPQCFIRKADSGHSLIRYFCGDCGSPLYGTSPEHPGVTYVKAGVIDQPFKVEPTHQSWCQSKRAWAEIDPDLPAYPKSKSG